MNQATLTPALAGQSTTRPAMDPIANALELLHTATRLPYTTARSRQWRRGFRQRVRAARQALRRHIARSSEEDSPMGAVDREQPYLHTAMERQRAEHRMLALQLDALCDEASAEEDVDIWRMIDLGERAMRLERELARHYERLVRLVYEGANREIGCAG